MTKFRRAAALAVALPLAVAVAGDAAAQPPRRATARAATVFQVPVEPRDAYDQLRLIGALPTGIGSGAPAPASASRDELLRRLQAAVAGSGSAPAPPAPPLPDTAWSGDYQRAVELARAVGASRPTFDALSNGAEATTALGALAEAIVAAGADGPASDVYGAIVRVVGLVNLTAAKQTQAQLRTEMRVTETNDALRRARQTIALVRREVRLLARQVTQLAGADRTGPPGPQGPAGPKGDPGPAAPGMQWAKVAADGRLLGATPGVTVASADLGRVEVVFPRNVEACATVATAGSAGMSATASAVGASVSVTTFSAADGEIPDDVSLVVHC